jgi:aconitate hydratase
LQKAGLDKALDHLGFHTVGYGCTTCIGNTGPLPDPIRDAINKGNLVAASVLSGNRNFEGRISQDVKANYLASPPLVVAYALAGRVDIDLGRDPLGRDDDGRDVYLRDIWPTNAQIQEVIAASTNPDAYRTQYADVNKGPEAWQAIPAAASDLFRFEPTSTYIQNPPFFADMSPSPEPIEAIADARVLVMVGDSVTTDHISPAGAIAADSPAGKFLIESGVERKDFNSYGSRRGNDRVMTRGTFANIRLRNQLAPGTEGGFTRYLPTGEQMSIYEAAQKYQTTNTALVVIAGKEYGTGSSRDWAAKGTMLLGVRMVLAESYERIHRSNLVGMGVLPLQFADGESRASLGLNGEETYSLALDDSLQAGATLEMKVTDASGASRSFPVLCRIDTPVEVDYYRNRGILQTVLRKLLAS